MKVILISEENHGIIGCVASEKDVMPWLVKENWVDQYTCVYNSKTDDFETLEDRYGLTWFQKLSKMNLSELTGELDDTFCFEPIEVWSKN